MEKDLNDSVVHNTSCLKESESDKSFVGKVKSIISNTPLSKWFRKQDDNRPVTRRRDEVFEDDDISEIQPPLKRAKLPIRDEEDSNNTLSNEICISTTNSVSNKIFNKILEPVAGPSGLKSHKLLSSANVSTNSARSPFSSNELLNGHSDSEESTSGYSSVVRIGSKEQVCGSQESSKQASPSQTSPKNSRSLFRKSIPSTSRSLFMERSLSPNMNTSLSSRRPNFNASTFGSPNFVDKTITTKKIINSPFYNGQTIYGGASAYGRSLGRSSQDLKMSLRNSVEIKPANKTTGNENLILGKTARRILDTIEQYSSPVSDAKKIPIVSRKTRPDGLLTKYVGVSPYVLRETKVSSNKELQVPNVSDLLKMKIRLQDSTETVKQIATSSKSDLNTEYYKIHTKEDEKEKHTGKMKTKITSVRQKHSANETVNEVNLVPVSLPITTLPKFDFVVPPPPSTKKESSPLKSKTTQPVSTSSSNAQIPPKTTYTESTHKERKTTTTSITEYKFSDPLVISENIKSIVAINDFKFSEPPICTNNKSDLFKNKTLNFKMPDKLSNLLLSKKGNNPDSLVKVAKTLKAGSVMDILGKKVDSQNDNLLEKFRPTKGTWECSACLIRNQPQKLKCAACETPKKELKTIETKNSFGPQFKLSSDKWECNACLVRNNISDNKCVSCTTPKLTPSSVSNSFTTSTPSGFGDKFKPSTNTWECSTCMIRNKDELVKCAACETPKPKAASDETQVEPSITVSNQQSSFGNTFKIKSDEWECSTCMVRNKASNTKCQCCETPNPKATSTSNSSLEIVQNKKPISTFNFGIDKAAATNFRFGIPTTCTSSSPGTQAPSIFGAKVVATPSAQNFSFGVPSQPKPADSALQAPTESPKTSTDTPVLSNSNTLLKSSEKSRETATTEFNFGVNATPSISKETTTTKLDVPVLTTITDNKATFNFKPAATKDTVAKAAPVVTTTGLFAFGAKPLVTTVTTVSSTQPSQSEPVKTMFKFGTSVENSSFGAATPVTSSLNNGFVNTSSSVFGTSTASSFEKPTNSTEVKPFTFDSSAKESSEPASKAPMFSFGQSASTVAVTTSAKTPGFNFASTTSTPTYNFSAGKSETPAFNATAPNNMFGTSNTNAQNGTFNFGSMASNNNAQKAGFSFGAAANSAASQPSLNFGASASTFAASTGGFNFSGATPNFNATAKPSFNFSEGNVAGFSAQPLDGGTSAPRKIKRAVRRTQR